MEEGRGYVGVPHPRVRYELGRPQEKSSETVFQVRLKPLKLPKLQIKIDGWIFPFTGVSPSVGPWRDMGSDHSDQGIKRKRKVIESGKLRHSGWKSETWIERLQMRPERRDD